MPNLASPQEVAEVRKLREDILTKDVFRGQDAIVDLADYYRSKYADYAKVHLFHELAGGTAPKTVTKPDFPGQDSVRVRLREILKWL